MKKIYIIQTHSGTGVARIIKLITKHEFTHVSISLNKNLNRMYSFGRRTLNNPLNSGFIIENIEGKFYNKFNKTNCRVFEAEIPYFKYIALKNVLKKYEKNPEKYNYDILGLLAKIFKINIKRKDKYVCSQFIAELLHQSQIHKFDKSPHFVKPEDFNNLPYKVIYTGKLKDYI